MVKALLFTVPAPPLSESVTEPFTGLPPGSTLLAVTRRLQLGMVTVPSPVKRPPFAWKVNVQDPTVAPPEELKLTRPEAVPPPTPTRENVFALLKVNVAAPEIPGSKS